MVPPWDQAQSVNFARLSAPVIAIIPQLAPVYAGSRERVRVALDEELRGKTRAAIANLRLTAAADRLPPPLVDSPKCTKCSLAGICLPDEVTFFRKGLAPRG